MKNLKKILITTLSLAMLASLAGCNSTEKAPDYQKIENQFTSSFEGTDTTFEPLEITDELKVLANEYAHSLSLYNATHNYCLTDCEDCKNDVYGLNVGIAIQQVITAPAYNNSDSMSSEAVRAAMLDLYAIDEAPEFEDQDFRTLVTYEDGIYTLFDGDIKKIYEELDYEYEEKLPVENCYYNLLEAKWSDYDEGVLETKFEIYDITEPEIAEAVANQDFEALKFIYPEKIISRDFKFDFENGQTKIESSGDSYADPLNYIVPIEIGLAEKDFVKAVQAGDDEQIVDKFNDYARQNMLQYVPNFETYEQLIRPDNLGMVQMQMLFIKHFQNRYMNNPDPDPIVTPEKMESLIQDVFYAENYTRIAQHSFLKEVVFENGEYSLLPGGTLHFNYEFYVLNNYDYTDNVFTANYERYYFNEYEPEEVEIAEALNKKTIKAEDFANCEPNATCTTKFFIDEETGQAKIISHEEIYYY